MWTAISRVLMLSCCCSLGESILPSAAEQLRERRADWLELEHGCTKQALSRSTETR